MFEASLKVEQKPRSSSYDGVQDFLNKHFIVNSKTESGESISLQRHGWLTQEYETRDGIELGLSQIATENLRLNSSDKQKPLLLQRVEVGNEKKHEALLVYQQLENSEDQTYQLLGIIGAFGAYYPFKEVQQTRDVPSSLDRNSFAKNLDTENAVWLELSQNQDKLGVSENEQNSVDNIIDFDNNKRTYSEIDLSDEGVDSLTISFSGNEKQFYTVELDPENKVLIAEYKRPISESQFLATIAQQIILNKLFPDVFVVQIHKIHFSENSARFLTNYYETDKEKSLNITGDNWDANAGIQYIQQIKDTKQFQELVEELDSIGFFSSFRFERPSQINELAGNTVFSGEGEQIILDVMKPIVQEEDEKQTLKYQPRININKLIELFRKKGLEIDFAMKKIIDLYIQQAQLAANEINT